MKTARIRREILVPLIMLSQSFDMLKQDKYKSLQNGPFRWLHPIDQLFQKMVPVERDRHKEQRGALRMINAITPGRYCAWPLDVKLWYTCGVVHRLVADGWFPRDYDNNIMGEFIQSLYSLYSSFTLKSVPSNAEEYMMLAPSILYKEGLYLSTAK